MTRCATTVLGRPLCAHLVGGLAEGERLGLCEDVRREQVVVVAKRVESLRERDEVDGNDLGALVQELVEAVLAVRAGLAPVDGARRVVDRVAVERSRACRWTPSSAAGGRRGTASGTGRRAGRRTISPPKKSTYQTASSPMSAGRFRSSGVVAKCTSISWNPAEQLRERLRADGEHRGQADRRVHRVAPADPVPEPEHVGRVDPELCDTLGVRGHRDEVFGDRASSPSAVE